MSRKERTSKKYADFIKECATKGTFSVRAMLDKHKVDASIITTMRQEECIVSVTADLSNWITSKPNEVLINRIIESHRDRLLKYRLARESKAKEKQMQEVASRPAPKTTELSTYKFNYVEPAPMTEEGAVAFLKSLGGYEIYKVERKQL